jgi:uncharacterized CHY-type Zn-finger protein
MKYYVHLNKSNGLKQFIKVRKKLWSLIYHKSQNVVVTTTKCGSSSLVHVQCTSELIQNPMKSHSEQMTHFVVMLVCKHMNLIYNIRWHYVVNLGENYFVQQIKEMNMLYWRPWIAFRM